MAGKPEDETEAHDPLAALFDEAQEEVTSTDLPEGEEEEAEEETPAVEEPPVEGAKPTKAAKEPVVEEDSDDAIPDGDTVPKGVLIAERAKWKERLRIRTAEAAKAAKPAPAEVELEPIEEVQVPDRATDPAGYADFVHAQTQATLLNEKLHNSERFAKKEYGAAVVDKAFEWAAPQFKVDPALYQRVIRSADPYEEIVNMHKAAEKAKLPANTTSEELTEFQTWKAARAKETKDGAGNTKPAKEKPTREAPPGSLAQEQSAEGEAAEPTGAGVAFGQMFGR